MDFSFSRFELKSLLIEAAEYGVKQALIEVGTVKPVLSKQEAYKLINRVTVDRAIESGALKTTKKGGVSSKIWIDRAAFNEWVHRSELASKRLTTPKIKK